MDGKNYDPMGQPHHHVASRHLWQKTQLGRKEKCDSKGVTILARTQMDLLIITKILLNQARRWVDIPVLVGCIVAKRHFGRGFPLIIHTHEGPKRIETVETERDIHGALSYQRVTEFMDMQQSLIQLKTKWRRTGSMGMDRGSFFDLEGLCEDPRGTCGRYDANQ